MSQKIQGGSVFPNPRLSPSGPLLSGEGGPVVQIAFDQVIFTVNPASTFSIPIPPGVPPPTEAEILASTIPRDVDDPTGDFLSVTLRGVKKSNMIAVWFSFGILHNATPAADGIVFLGLGFDDGAGNDAGLIGFATQELELLGGSAAGSKEGSIVTFGPNPYGAQRDVRLFPVAFSLENPGLIKPASNQNAILAAEIAKT
jgi:hypothetical protein